MTINVILTVHTVCFPDPHVLLSTPISFPSTYVPRILMFPGTMLALLFSFFHFFYKKFEEGAKQFL